MPKFNNLIQLIHSLNKAEKRHFKLYTGLQKGKKDYVQLFDMLLGENKEPEKAKTRFIKKHPGVSFDNTCQHLYRILMKCLLVLHDNYQTETVLCDLLKEINMLVSKEIYEEAFKVIQKAINLAKKHELHYWILLLLRKKIELESYLDFAGINEKELSRLHVQADKTLQICQSIQQHASLYDTAIFRFNHRGMIRNETEKQQMNDLLLAEAAMAKHPHHKTYESKKLHLMFQSVYFRMTGDNKSALRTYFELNELFEKNHHLWNDPPVHLISHLKAVLSHLRNSGRHDEMGYFLNRLRSVLDARSEKLIIPILYQYELYYLMDNNLINKAIQYYSESLHDLNRIINLITPASRAEIYLANAILLFHQDKYKEAARMCYEVLNSRKIFNLLPVYKTVRLFSLIVHLEVKNHDYLEHEVRSFERELQKRNNLFEAERIIFRFIKRYIHYLIPEKRMTTIVLFQEQIKKIKDHPYEKQILSHFDFYNWATNKITITTLNTTPM
jgi:hypothetical protein